MQKSVMAAAAGLAIGMAMTIAVPVSADETKVPPEVTPALRAACEADAKRLCIRDDSTVSEVKQCMLVNFMKLASKCQKQIVLAGLGP